jgi:hypothetical protein
MVRLWGYSVFPVFNAIHSAFYFKFALFPTFLNNAEKRRKGLAPLAIPEA